MFTKTIACLANSRKTSGRCIAGKEWNGGKAGQWIRPVSSRPKRELSEEDRLYEDGTDPRLLDILTVPLSAQLAAPHQSENHLIDDNYYWQRVGRLTWDQAQRCGDNPVSLWGLHNASYAGLNNRVHLKDAPGESLYLIATDSVELLVGKKAPEYADSKRAVRGQFRFRGVTYRLDVTDPVIERRFLPQADGSYVIEAPMLCVSLGEPYEDGYCYKLIAAVLFPERFQ